LLLLALGILLAGRSDLAALQRLRATLLDWVAPLAEAVSRPIETGRAAVAEIGDYLALKLTVDQLRAENLELKGWEDRARQLEAENQALRSLLLVPADMSTHYVTARVVADASSGYVRGVIVLAGSASGVAKGQAAIAQAGLAGRVLEVGKRASRVLLLTDINSRVPVMVERTRDQVVLAGNNTDQPEIRYLTRGADIKVGDRLVTSGAGGAFPPGLPVGEVVSVGESGVAVSTFADLGRLEFVKLVNYGLPGVLAEEFALAPGAQTDSPSSQQQTR
jgi:rod shape-determining protein MreC